jgi:hypothetical protein
VKDLEGYENGYSDAEIIQENQQLKAEIERLKANRLSAFSTDELRLITEGLYRVWVRWCKLMDEVNLELDRREATK